jgi:hypothetical protein
LTDSPGEHHHIEFSVTGHTPLIVLKNVQLLPPSLAAKVSTKDEYHSKDILKKVW